MPHDDLQPDAHVETSDREAHAGSIRMLIQRAGIEDLAVGLIAWQAHHLSAAAPERLTVIIRRFGEPELVQAAPPHRRRSCIQCGCAIVHLPPRDQLAFDLAREEVIELVKPREEAYHILFRLDIIRGSRF
jgi:hypothetical protein